MNSIEKSNPNNPNNLSNPELNAPEIKIPDVDKLIHPDFEKDDIIEKDEGAKKIPPSEGFNRLVKLFYDSNLYTINPESPGYHELEVRFGTKDLKDVKRLTKNDYDNVIKVLKNFGFDTWEW